MRTIISSFIAGLALLTAFPAYGADVDSIGITLRTDMVQTINSIALKDSEEMVIRKDGALPVAVYRMDFSVHAYDANITLPVAVTRGDSDVQGIEFVIESRDKDIVESGYAAGVLLPHNPEHQTNGIYTVAKGTTETFTLLVLYADTPDSSREDRMRVSGMTLKAFTQTAELHPSEITRLHTDYVELVETR